MIDTGLGEPPQVPTLLAFCHDFPPETGPVGSFLNDLAVDDERGFVYLADVGWAHRPALVVVDVNRQVSRRCEDSPALQAEDVELVVEGRVISSKLDDGGFKPARIAVNPITLSGDGETLSFGAMNGRTWYQLPARLLRERAADAAIAAAITAAGPTPVSDGASTDLAGNH